jgi:Lon protease-like protein
MREIPLFPLHTVLFPGMPLQLHIFEPRYRSMVRDCVEGGQMFGVVLIRQGVEAGGPAIPYPIGCSAQIIDLEPLSDGEFNLTALGEERFQIIELQHDKPYLRATVEYLPMEKPQTLETLQGSRRLSPWIRSYLDLLEEIEGPEMDLKDLILPPEPLPLLYMAASLLQLPPVEKQPLLESKSAHHLLIRLLRLYRRELALAPTLTGERRGKTFSPNKLN